MAIAEIIITIPSAITAQIAIFIFDLPNVSSLFSQNFLEIGFTAFLTKFCCPMKSSNETVFEFRESVSPS